MDYVSHVVSCGLSRMNKGSDIDPIQCCAAGLPCLLPGNLRKDPTRYSEDPRVLSGFNHHIAVDLLLHRSPQFQQWEWAVRTHINGLQLGRHPSKWAYHVLTEQIIGAFVVVREDWKNILRSALESRSAFIACLRIPDDVKQEMPDIANILDRMHDALVSSYADYHLLPRFAQRCFTRVTRTHARFMGADASRVDDDDWQDALRDAITRAQQEIFIQEVQALVQMLSLQVMQK